MVTGLSLLELALHVYSRTGFWSNVEDEGEEEASVRGGVLHEYYYSEGATFCWGSQV